MNHAQLRAFHAVARAGSFTGAARATGLSQPNLSGQVRALEAAYGVRLFERRGRGADLTELGRRLYALTDRIFALEGEAQALLAGSKALAIGHLRIAADNAIHAMPIMAELKRRHPGVSLSLIVGNSDAVIARLTGYQADVGITARRPSDPRFHAVAYSRDRLIVFVPQGHALARRRRIALRDLEGRDMVLREPGSVTRAVFERSPKPGCGWARSWTSTAARRCARRSPRAWASASPSRANSCRTTASSRWRRPMPPSTSASTWSAWRSGCG
jgi:DNA-binding transcriptional LysR family regulator